MVKTHLRSETPSSIWGFHGQLQVFQVSEVVKTAEDQTYLKLADRRGWVRVTQRIFPDIFWVCFDVFIYRED